LRELALFAGAGGGILGGHLLGWRTVCAVEYDAYAASVLVARQNDGCLPPFPVWDDVRTFDGGPWRGRVDVISGGFPCQDISTAGKGAGIGGERSGLWREFARIIREVRPRYVFVENSPALVTRGLGVVLGDLAALGYDAEWGVLGADDVGAPHRRKRIWIVADAEGQQDLGRERGVLEAQAGEGRRCDPAAGSSCEDVGDAESQPIGAGLCEGEQGEVWRGRSGDGCGSRDVADAQSGRRERGNVAAGGGEGEGARILPESARNDCGSGEWWAVEPGLGRVAHGVAHRVDRLKCIGNGQVPQVAALAWRLLGGDGA